MNTRPSKQYFYFMLINKYGSLVYQKAFLGDYSIETNQSIMMASSFHTMSALSSIITPPTFAGKSKDSTVDTKSGNKIRIETVVTDQFKVNCYETLTGLKLLLVSDPSLTNADSTQFLKNCYELYSDYVLKDPSYVPDQPFKNKIFDKALLSLVD